LSSSPISLSLSSLLFPTLAATLPLFVGLFITELRAMAPAKGRFPLDLFSVEVHQITDHSMALVTMRENIQRVEKEREKERDKDMDRDRDRDRRRSKDKDRERNRQEY
ncbi:U2 snRNP auxilliary factor, large subunit, splicing factor, partial [Prunus dulcis]